jgi:hypothetical protein
MRKPTRSNAPASKSRNTKPARRRRASLPRECRQWQLNEADPDAALVLACARLQEGHDELLLRMQQCETIDQFLRRYGEQKRRWHELCRKVAAMPAHTPQSSRFKLETALAVTPRWGPCKFLHAAIESDLRIRP